MSGPSRVVGVRRPAAAPVPRPRRRRLPNRTASCRPGAARSARRCRCRLRRTPSHGRCCRRDDYVRIRACGRAPLGSRGAHSRHRQAPCAGRPQSVCRRPWPAARHTAPVGDPTGSAAPRRPADGQTCPPGGAGRIGRRTADGGQLYPGFECLAQCTRPGASVSMPGTVRPESRSSAPLAAPGQRAVDRRAGVAGRCVRSRRSLWRLTETAIMITIII